MLSPFNITIISGRAYTFVVKQIMVGETTEIYQVIGKNKSITVESNRPLWRNKNLKHHKPTWKMNAGTLHNIDFLEKIYAAIMDVVDK